MLQTGRQLERVHAAEAEGWLMTGMYFMAKIKEPRLRSTTLTKMKRDSEQKRERDSFSPQDFKWDSVTRCGYYHLIRDRPFTRSCLCACVCLNVASYTL